MVDRNVPAAIESPLVVASNRGPVTYEPDEAGQLEPRRGMGGLVTVLSGVFYRDEATWVSSAMTEGDRELAKEPDLVGPGDLRLRFVSVDADTYDRFYNRIANGVLWPTHHFLWDVARTPVFDESTWDDWEAFEATNRAFAEVLDEAPRDAVFLIQDYQLPLAPRYLRELRPRARIAHFSHTPFAGPTYLHLLPARIRNAVLRGMAGADVIGFQTRWWAENFLLSARALPGAKVDLRRGRLSLEGHTSLVHEFPVSPSVEQLQATAAAPGATAIRERLRAEIGDRRLLLRVDRLDPSKNVLRGFLAYERFLQRNPEWRGRVRFLALLQPSRQELAVYREYADACLAEARRINADLGDRDWAPVTVRTQHDPVYAVAAFGLYDALLVNPVYDGMNLVAMEGPLLNRHAGVLVLSRNAGAYARLGRQSLGVNPFDIGETADAIKRALEMDEAERRRRARGLSRTIAAHTPAMWLAAQLDVLDRAVALGGPAEGFAEQEPLF